MKKRSNILATILLITMLLSVFAQATALGKSTNSTTSEMNKTQGVFGGSFSPCEVAAVPGETFEATFNLCPTIDASNTIVSFVLPANLVELVSGSQVWTGNLKKGESLPLTLSLVANGDVDAYVRANVEAPASSQNYESSYYLHVTTSSKGINSYAVSDSMKAGSLRSVNLEYVSTAPNTASSRAPQNSIAPLSTSGTFEVKGRFVYLDENGGSSSARYMEVRLRDNNDSAWSVTGWTNGTGYFWFIAANSAGGRSPILDLIAEGSWDWKGTDSNGAQYWWTTGVLGTNVADGWVWTNYGLSPGNNDDILQAGDAVYAESQMIYDWTGWMRSKVTIKWPVGIAPGNTGDIITLPVKSTWSWNHITVQHEEAHCVMWALYGNTWPSTAHSGESHRVYDEKDGGFAMIEGWGEFMACAVDNNPSNLVGWYNGHGGNIETNDWFNCITNGNMDGNIIEGSVASILWDIFDPVNIAGDNDRLSGGFTYIFTVMQNDKPGDMLQFWNDWTVRSPDNSTSQGPLCDTYYQYGIDEDWFNPWGSISINGGATYTNSRTVTLTLDGKDWGAGVKHMRFSEDYGVTFGSWYDYAPTFTYTITSPGDGWKYIDVQYADYWWLSAAGTIYDGIGLDTTPPTGTILIANGSAYTTSRTVTLNLTATDNYSGAALMRFSENMGAWGSWVPFAKAYSYTLTTANDGFKSVDVQFQDNAVQNSTMWGIYDYIYLDPTKPTGTVLINNGSIATTSTSVYLNLTYTDTGSGISKIRFGNTGDPWSAWETPSPTKAWTIPTGDGTKNVWCEVMDNAGLISDQFYDGIILDTINPTGSIVVGSGNPTYTTSTAVTLYLTYADTGSGVYQVRYGNTGEPWSAWEAPSATKAWTLTAGDGTKTVWYQVMDNAGLLSTMYSDDIILQTSIGFSVVRGANNIIYYCSCSGGVWGNWNALPGSTIDSPAAAICSNMLHVVVRGSVGDTLWYGSVNLATNAFSGWTLLSGSSPSAPTLTANSTHLALVVRGQNNLIYYRFCTVATLTWTDWTAVPSGATCDSPAAAMLGNNLHLVVRGFSNTDPTGNVTLWNIIVKSNGVVVRGWINTGGATISRPVLTANQTANKLYLAVRGQSSQIWWRSYDGSTDSWAGWNALPGTTCDGPAAMVMDNKLCTVVRSMSGDLLWSGYVNLGSSTFSGWTLLSGSTPSAPTLTS